MGWQIKSLGETCTLATGGTPSRAKPEYFENGTIKWLVSGDIHQKEIYNCNGKISELGLQNSNARYLPENSVMIALNGQGKTRGSVSLLRTKATCNQSLVSICPNNTSELIPEFLYVNLHGRYEEIRKMTGDDGNDRRGLNMPLIRSIKIPGSVSFSIVSPNHYKFKRNILMSIKKHCQNVFFPPLLSSTVKLLSYEGPAFKVFIHN